LAPADITGGHRAALFDTLRRFDSTSLANAIETFDVRLRNEGFTDGSVRAQFPELAPVVGYAVTARIRCSTPPPVGHLYYDRTDWWLYIKSVPAPRVVIVEDVDDRPGLGAFVGHVHASILKALDCVAYATNGSVRDLPAVRQTGLQLFAGGTSVSHAFVHIVDFGGPVLIGGLRVNSNDIVYGDRHGLLTIPPEIAPELPAAAARVLQQDQRVVEFCGSPAFSLETLRTIVRPPE
jgi:4-hydroxy-4-methyl-2-oxoglutarate aldolase